MGDLFRCELADSCSSTIKYCSHMTPHQFLGDSCRLELCQTTRHVCWCPPYPQYPHHIIVSLGSLFSLEAKSAYAVDGDYDIIQINPYCKDCGMEYHMFKHPLKNFYVGKCWHCDSISLFSRNGFRLEPTETWYKHPKEKGGIIPMNIRVNGVEVEVEEGMEIRITSQDVSILRPSLLVSLKSQGDFAAPVAAKKSSTLKAVGAIASKLATPKVTSPFADQGFKKVS